MNKKRKPENASEIVDLIFDYMATNAPDTKDDLIYELKEDGVDTEKVLGSVQDMVAGAKKKMRLSWIETARYKMADIQDAFRRASVKRPGTSEELRSSIKQLKLLPSFRNLKHLSEEDWVSIWEDWKMLEQVDDDPK